jgi:hypothetical protein
MPRRQQFFNEATYEQLEKDFETVLEMFRSRPAGSGDTVEEGWLISARRIAWNLFERVTARYTAGAPIAPLRQELELVVAAFERYSERHWAFTEDRNEVVFHFGSIDEYCALLQLVGLCFLLHRRDLLPRIAAMQDGVDALGQKGQGNGGTDWVFEELMAFGLGPENRYESDTICCSRPYEALADALSSADNTAALNDLDRFLKRWYKDLAGTAWHDSHKPDEQGRQGGYYGYWSFEAGAAVLLLGIDDDSSLHKYLYYPKDLVAWARAHQQLSATEAGDTGGLRCEAGQPCPRAGWWFTPAQAGSRRRFQQGEVMPDTKSPWGATIWQWDRVQDGEGA